MSDQRDIAPFSGGALKTWLEASETDAPSELSPEAGSAYRLLSEGEIIEENDEFMDDSGVWRKTICAGEAAPNPVFTSHRQYRREERMTMANTENAELPTPQGSPHSLVRLACDSWRCGWRGDSAMVLRAPDPFNEGRELTACPKCREQTIRTCCDEPGCWENDTCGTPTPNGYRRTCWRHQPNAKNKP